MKNNNWKYCFINLYKHENDIGAINSTLKYIIDDETLELIEVDGSKYLGFKIENHDISVENTKEYKLIPFVFKFDEEENKFVDYITGERYTYHTFNDGTRIYYEDKGEAGEYLKPVDVKDFGLTEKDISNYVKNLNGDEIQCYRKAIRKLCGIITMSHKEFYLPIKREERVQERKKEQSRKRA